MKPLLFLLSVMIAACVHLPPGIENPPPYDLAYHEALTRIKNVDTAPIRWGGVIVGVENQQDSSLVQVLYYPLSRHGKPQIENAPLGRFVFKTAEFLDPAIYTKNRLVTVAGALSGAIERKVGEKSLTLPLVAATTVYLWPLQPRDIYGPGSVGFGYYPFGFGYYPYYWRPYYRFYAPFW